MLLRRWTFSVLLFGNFSVAAGETKAVPSDPTTWYGDFQSLVVPTEECPGGTVEQLGKRLTLSEPYSLRVPDAAQRFSVPTLIGIEDSDWVHEFYFSSELPGGSFWGFSGYLMSRGSCVIHAEVTNIDN